MNRFNLFLRTTASVGLAILALPGSAMAEPAGANELTSYEKSLACKFSQTCDAEAVEVTSDPASDDQGMVVGEEAPFNVFSSKGAAPAPAARASAPVAAVSGSGPKLYSGSARRPVVAVATKAPVRVARAIAKPRVKAAAVGARRNAAEMQVLFGNDSTALDALSLSEIKAWSNVFASPQYATMRIRIEGHTNAVGNREHNLDLSQRRARAVMDYMIGQGIPASRIEAVGFGFDKPRSSDPRDGENRRVEIVKAD